MRISREVELEFDLDYTIDPGERRTFDYPGSPPSVEVTGLKLVVDKKTVELPEAVADDLLRELNEDESVEKEILEAQPTPEDIADEIGCQRYHELADEGKLSRIRGRG